MPLYAYVIVFTGLILTFVSYCLVIPWLIHWVRYLCTCCASPELSEKRCSCHSLSTTVVYYPDGFKRLEVMERVLLSYSLAVRLLFLMRLWNPAKYCSTVIVFFLVKYGKLARSASSWFVEAVAYDLSKCLTSWFTPSTAHMCFTEIGLAEGFDSPLSMPTKSGPILVDSRPVRWNHMRKFSP